MPGMEMPVRMTTAMIFFIVGGIAAYYASTTNAELWLVVKCSFILFIALGPVYWVQELVIQLPVGREADISNPDTYHFVTLENVWLGLATMWVCSLLRVILIGLSLGLLTRAMLTGDFGAALFSNSE